MTSQVADICLVGVGAVGGILAKELTSAGLKVVAFERGPAIQLEDYASRDSIRFVARHDQLDWVRHEPTIFRTHKSEKGELRYSTSPLNALGGALLHWTGQVSRFMPGDFKVFSNEIASGVAERAGADLSGYDVVDWPIGYEALEPYYERFEWEFGVSGVAGKNPFAGSRKRDYPLPPLRRSAKMELVEAACLRLGYHPFDGPSGILSQPYQPPNPYDARIRERQACVYCGHCNNYGCHVQAKATALYTVIPVALETGNLELRTSCKVFRINTDSKGNATGVSYFDPDGRIQQQRAKVVILSAYVFENVRLLLLSKSDHPLFRNGLANSSGLVGRYFLGHGDVRIHGVFDDYIINAFIGPGSAAIRMDDFNGNNFDHTGLGFIRGGTMGSSGDGAPISRLDVVPSDVKSWGRNYKEFIGRYFTRTLDIHFSPETLPHHENHIDLDPRRRDRWGIPLPRATFSFHQNEARMHRFMAQIGERILQETGANRVWSKQPRPTPTRQAGGTRMGKDARGSVVNEYCQAHDVSNLFVLGSSVFPTMAGYPATATIGALAYRTAEYIVSQRDWFR
jgi:gluconate 2-dehydrogenase alpha chain